MIVHMAKYNVSTDVKWSVEPYYCDCCCLKQFELQSFPCFNVSMIKCTKLYYSVFLEYYRLFDLNCWLELWYGQKKNVLFLFWDVGDWGRGGLLLTYRDDPTRQRLISIEQKNVTVGCSRPWPIIRLKYLVIFNDFP